MQIIKYIILFILSSQLTTETLLYAQANSIPALKGSYLGQKLPGVTAEIFAKGILSTDLYEHSAPAFSPDGKIVVWGIVERGKPSYLLEMKQENDLWTQAAQPSFGSGIADDLYPRFSVDGKKLYFTSRRMLPPGFPALKDSWIWVVEKTKKGWSEPVPMDSAIFEGVEYSHSISKTGTIFFSFRKEGGKIFDIAYTKKIGNAYSKREILADGINSAKTEDGPYISPDEDFLIFESNREGGFGSNDLYICFKEKNGRWSQPKNMGSKINTDKSERFAGLSPDGKYLFFGSDRNGNSDIFWINTKVIVELKSN